MTGTGMGLPQDKSAGFARGQEFVWGFDNRTAIDSKVYGAPGAKIFYVDPNNSQATDAGNLGEDPTVPLATVAAALVLARPYAGDTIVVGANDAWQYAARTYRPLPIQETLVIPATKGGIRIVGAATNPLACVWTPEDDNETAITVYACDVTIEGFAFYPIGVTGNTAIAAVWDNTAGRYGENLTVRNCYFEESLDYGITLSYTWNCRIYNNYFGAVDEAAIYNVAAGTDADHCNVFGNEFYDCDAAIALASCSDCRIHGNLIYGDPTGTNNFIDLTGGADNLVTENWLACSIAQYDVTCSDATSGAWVRNHCINGDTAANPV